VLSANPLFRNKRDGKEDTNRRARRPATFIEYQTFGKKGLGMGNSMLFSHFGKFKFKK